MTTGTGVGDDALAKATYQAGLAATIGMDLRKRLPPQGRIRTEGTTFNPASWNYRSVSPQSDQPRPPTAVATFAVFCFGANAHQ